jgi:hypothetical protein
MQQSYAEQGAAARHTEQQCMVHLVHGMPNHTMHVFVPTDGGSYVFDAAAGPQAVFARFFGTSNPYEALSCECLTAAAAAVCQQLL